MNKNKMNRKISKLKIIIIKRNITNINKNKS